jgi:cellulose synthase/poly-beta-1,6-N-acetylglucosamine synthase-like glycosyltransferase
MEANMYFNWIAAITILSGVLIVYHHVGYPLLLKWLANKSQSQHDKKLIERGFINSKKDVELPKISILMPAYNEEKCIAEKIRNLATLDYPPAKLQIFLICDGCSDGTANIAYQTHKEPECSHLNLAIMENQDNQGKLAILNTWIPQCNSSFVALSDVSALLSVDALLAAVSHFKDTAVGVVCGKYQLLNPVNSGEEAYWKYQTTIKERESATGSIIGVHGAFYVFRKDLFKPLPKDTINDDFVLPMEIVAQGYRGIYETRIHALELEKAPADIDGKRRRRIAAGNLQQVIRLKRVLSFQYGKIFFNFLSGKTLRVFMPICLLILFFGSSALSLTSIWFAGLFGAQLLVYGLAGYRHLTPNHHVPKFIHTIYYLVSGYLNTLIGELRYCLGFDRGGWRRATSDQGE